MTPDLRILSFEYEPRRKRIAVGLSDGSSFRVTPDIAARFGLSSGQALTAERVETIAAAQTREDAMAAALRLVAFRPRSEKEMRQALGRRAMPPDVRDDTISRLLELGLLDDVAFAASFVESRDRSSPRSRRLLAQELRQKGVAREIAGATSASIDDSDAAYRAAERRARAMSSLPYADFERRLGTFLLRRGFTYETTRQAVRRLWGEQLSGEAGDTA